MKCDVVQGNAHIMVIGFRNSNFLISNKRKLGKLYCEGKISKFGDAELKIQGKQ